MKIYLTEIRAVSPLTGEMKLYGGPNIPAISFSDAEAYCENNGLGYCKVIGELVCEIPLHEGTMKPDWEKQIDYDIIAMN